MAIGIQPRVWVREEVVLLYDDKQCDITIILAQYVPSHSRWAFLAQWIHTRFVCLSVTFRNQPSSRSALTGRNDSIPEKVGVNNSSSTPGPVAYSGFTQSSALIQGQANKNSRKLMEASRTATYMWH
jgi:hypothetical protein